MLLWRLERISKSPCWHHLACFPSHTGRTDRIKDRNWREAFGGILKTDCSFIPFKECQRNIRNKLKLSVSTLVHIMPLLWATKAVSVIIFDKKTHFKKRERETRTSELKMLSWGWNMGDSSQFACYSDSHQGTTCRQWERYDLRHCNHGQHLPLHGLADRVGPTWVLALPAGDSLVEDEMIMAGINRVNYAESCLPQFIYSSNK